MIKRIATAIIVAVSVLFAGILLGPGVSAVAAQAAPADCTAGNVPRNIDSDTTLSGDLFATTNIYVENEATLTLEPGTHLIMCDEYDINVDRKSALDFVGTADSPIIIESPDPSQQWGQIQLGWETDASILRHVILRHGGGRDATATVGALSITPLGNSPDTAGPTIDHVTIEDSTAYGLYVDTYHNDPMPPSLTNLTITGSAQAPLYMNGADVSGLGTGNTLTGNGVDTVRVNYADIVSDQTWHAQDVPYELTRDLRIKSNMTPTLTIEPGTHFLLHPDVDVSVGRPGTLNAVGTAANPIVFDSTENGQKWGQLYFGWDSDASVLQYAVLRNGGGNDPSADVAALHVEPLGDNSRVGPVVDHVTVQDSGAFGVYVDGYHDDTTPAVLTNLTIERSVRAPILIHPHMVGGLGPGLTATDNSPNHIQVPGGRIVYDQRWRDLGIPYEVMGHIYLRSAYDNPDLHPVIMTVDPGVTMLVQPATSFSGGDLYGEGAFEFNGTEADPITVTRLDDGSAPWGGFSFGGFNDTDSKFNHVDFLYGGSINGDREAVFYKDGTSQLILDHVSIQRSQNGAVNVRGGSAWIKDSTLTFNRFGVRTYDQDVTIRSSDLSNNAEFSVENYYPTKFCIDAVGNYWGHNGPQDDSADMDGCRSTRTNAGSGSVSDGVAYAPWQTGQDGSGAYGAIAPTSFWVLADGKDSTEVVVQLKDAQGQPLAGKDVQLETTVGVVQQPTSPTNADGETTAIISSTETGFATLTAMNVTDGDPVPGTGGINFWQGSGDFGGLINPTGAPYASPALEVIGEPFQQGFPVDMRMPMQNTRSTPVDVQVIYGVTGLSIGTSFTPVYTATKTLQPSQFWNAQGVWVPDVIGHHCIQAKLTYDDGTTLVAAQTGGGTRQQNTDQNPCAGLPSGPGDFGPGKPDGGPEDLKNVAKHFKDQTLNMLKAVRCIKQEVNFRSLGLNGQRDYQVIVALPTYTPPTVQAGPNLSQDKADALNALAQNAAKGLALTRALAATQQRMQWAAQAHALGDLDRQYQAYQNFMTQYVQTLRAWADQHDGLLAVTEGAGLADAYFYPEDYQAALDDLVQNGFTAEESAYLTQSGLGAGLIAELRQDIIDKAQNQSFQTTSFYASVRASRDEARQIADQLERQYGLGGSGVLAAATGKLKVGPQPFDFVVGHPYDQEKTVDLSVRNVSMPMDWGARLAKSSVTLGAGETMTNTLTLEPGPAIPEASTVQVAVEGYVDGEYIGGILFTYNAPAPSNPRANEQIYLPQIIR